MIHQDQVLLEKRPEKRTWAGLWCFPESQAPIKESSQAMPAFKHVLTHRQMTIKPIKVHLKKRVRLRENQQWFSLDDVDGLGLPKPMSLFLRNLNLVRDGE